MAKKLSWLEHHVDIVEVVGSIQYRLPKFLMRLIMLFRTEVPNRNRVSFVNKKVRLAPHFSSKFFQESAMPDIKLPDGSIRSYEQAVTVAEVAASIGAGLARAALAGKVDGNPGRYLF